MSEKADEVFDDIVDEPSSLPSVLDPSTDLNPDPKVLVEIEAYAKSISSNLDMALRDLRGALRGFSDLSLESMQVFSSIINETCDSVDTVIRSTYTMVAKAEELHVCLEGIQQLARQIKELKQMIDLLESHSLDAPSI